LPRIDRAAGRPDQLNLGVIWRLYSVRGHSYSRRLTQMLHSGQSHSTTHEEADDGRL